MRSLSGMRLNLSHGQGVARSRTVTGRWTAAYHSAAS